MTEYISRDELKEALLRRGFYPVFVRAALESLPVIDIVRCKDCKHCEVINEHRVYAVCRRTNFEFLSFQTDTRTHFCSYGERREPMIERARYLYHVTKPENVESIMRDGLRRGGKRRGCMVHLSESPLSWWREGLRILRVDISGLDHIEANTFLPKSDEVIFWGDIPPTMDDGKTGRIEDVTEEIKEGYDGI